MKKVALAVLLAALAFPAPGAMLYKSVGPNGTIMFSDVPPPGARVLEQRVIGSSGTITPGSQSSQPSASIDPLLDGDAEVARASAQVDQAERELALARRELWSPREGLSLVSRRMSLADRDRVEFYKRNLKFARQSLIDMLRERASIPREAGAPRVVASR